MSFWRNPSSAEKPYTDPTPLPAEVPKVQELGVTSAPLKSAAFFIGAYCKDYNGKFVEFGLEVLRIYVEDVRLGSAAAKDARAILDADNLSLCSR
jgi:hypothetical protein